MRSILNKVMFVACLLAGTWVVSPARAAAPSEQRVFKTPEAAVTALVEAVEKSDTKTIAAILGPEGRDIISSGDPVADKNGRKRFIDNVMKRCELVEVGADRRLIRVGDDHWPFPIPIVKVGAGWRYDTQTGRQEVINRRVGMNEIDAVDTCHALVEVQHDYHTLFSHYAARFISTPHKHDGLYWPIEPNKPASPLGPIVVKATDEGYRGGHGTPYHGYRYRILTAQGASARGGAMSYLKNDKLTGGFAIVAYPAQYGVSGVYTFIVNQDGIVYQKNLGAKTVETAGAMTEFDPDSSWSIFNDLP